MTMKMVTDLGQFFSENMQEAVPELASEAEQSHDSLLKKLGKGLPEKEYMELENAVLDLVGLYEPKGFPGGWPPLGRWWGFGCCMPEMTLRWVAGRPHRSPNEAREMMGLLY